MISENNIHNLGEIQLINIIEDLVLLLLGVILIKFDSEFLSLVKKSKH